MLLPEEKAPLAALFGARVWSVPRREQPRALRALVDEALAALEPSHLIVDALPGGVLEELRPLPDVPRRTLLLRLHRSLEPAGVHAFDDVIDLEAHLGWRPSSVPARAFAPVTRALAPDAPPVDAALFAGSDPQRRALFARLAARVRERGYHVVTAVGAPRTPFALEGHAPRVVVGAAGFNLSYEAARARAWQIAIPRSRAFDDQRRRAERMADVPRGPHELERLLLERLVRLEREQRPPLVELASFDELAAALTRGSRAPPRGGAG